MTFAGLASIVLRARRNSAIGGSIRFADEPGSGPTARLECPWIWPAIPWPKPRLWLKDYDGTPSATCARIPMTKNRPCPKAEAGLTKVRINRAPETRGNPVGADTALLQW